LGFVLGAILIGFGATQPLADFTGPPIGINLLREINLTVTPSGGYGLDPSTLSLFLTGAAALAVLGLLLLVTRVRFLGLVWRLGGLIVLAVPALLSYSNWMFITDPTATLKQRAHGDLLGQGIAILAEQTRGIAWDVAPGTGLYLLSGGVICGVLASLVPAMRRQEVLYERTPR
jgi:hypothetical protein